MESAFQLRESLRKLERILGLLEESQASCCGTSLTQCHALVEIGRNSHLTLNGLAEILSLDKSTTSRVVQSLVIQNWVTRRESSEDRRNIELALTEQGTAQFTSIEKTMNDYYKRVIELLEPSHKENVIQSMHVLIEALDKANKDHLFPVI